MPLHLTLPPTSLKPFSDFMNVSFINRRRPTWASVVQIGLKRVEASPQDYSVATFKKLYDFSGEELMHIKQYAETFREQIRQSLAQPPTLMENVVEELSDASSYNTMIQGEREPLNMPYSSVIDGERDDLPL